MDVVVEWVDARERLPRVRDGWPVVAAVSGRYPPDDQEESGEDFWVVLPMHFYNRHLADDGTEYRNCFIDSDRVVRTPYGSPGDDSVTHWAELPALPGMTVDTVRGEEARTALRNALS